MSQDKDGTQRSDIESPLAILNRAETLQRELDVSFRDHIVESIYQDAETIAGRVVHSNETRSYRVDQKIDRIVTSKLWGLPFMAILLAMVFWVTIEGANVPSAMLA